MIEQRDGIVIDGLSRIENESGLFEQLERWCHDLGFTHFALGHHVNLWGPPIDAIGLSNYHPDWISRSIERGYFRDDPVHRASTRTGAGFLWSSIPNMVKLTPRQRSILNAAREFGLGVGFTVPVNIPGEHRGTCSFSAPSFDRLRPNALMLAQSIGSFAFEAARRLVDERLGILHSHYEIPSFTDRRRDVLVLLCRGNSDADIGRLLGISQATAHSHVEYIRRAYGNAQRSYLVARALFDGQVSWREVFLR